MHNTRTKQHYFLIFVIVSMSALISMVDRRKQVSRVSSAILIRVSLFNHFVSEQALSQIYVLSNMEHIFSARSGKLPFDQKLQKDVVTLILS